MRSSFTISQSDDKERLESHQNLVVYPLLAPDGHFYFLFGKRFGSIYKFICQPPPLIQTIRDAPKSSLIDFRTENVLEMLMNFPPNMIFILYYFPM